MAWLEREFIAVPPDRKNQLVFKWPDLSIRRFTRAIVNADEVALFVKAGHVVATLGPGRHRIDADQLPVLGSVTDSLTGGSLTRSELYFVATREFSGIRFGGRLADIVDPRTEQVVTLRAYGEFALTVRDPVALITKIVGTGELTEPDRIGNWCAELVLKSMKIAVARGISQGRWPVIGLSAYLAEVESEVLGQANRQLFAYGLRAPRMGNFDVNMAPEDAERLKRLAKDLKYVDLAGGFENYAAGEFALNAGTGMTRGGPGSDAVLLGAALGLGPSLNRRQGAPCDRCDRRLDGSVRFCPHCGARQRDSRPGTSST